MRDRSKSLEILLYAIFLAFLLDPGNSIFKLKFPLFALLLLWWLKNGMQITKIEFEFIAIFLSSTVISSVVGILHNGSFSFSVGIIMSSGLFLLMPIFRIYDGSVIKIFSRACLVVAFLIIILFIAELVLPHSLILPLYTFGNAHNSFTIDFRYYAGIRFGNVYFHASPMFVVADAYYTDQYLKRKNVQSLIPAVVVVAAFFLTGSRNNMIVALLIPVILIFIEGSRKQKLAVILIFLIFAASVIPVLRVFFDTTDYSNSIKLGYFSIFGKVINSNSLNWITGCGLGTTVYVPAVEKEVYLTELTYLNCIYWFGIPMCLILFRILATPIFKKMEKSEKYVKVIYVMFLYLCSLNPFLFNSVGITVLSICIYHLYEYIPNQAESGLG